jgi:DNA-binding MarR family transcriptional regulator
MSIPLIQTLHEWMRVTMRHSMRNFMLYAKEKNYSMAQLNAMFRIHHKGACGISNLGEEMGVTSAAASQLLEKLVQQGLATRAEDPQDRRNKVVALTEAGQRIVQESMAARQSWLANLAEQLSPTEQEQAQAALQLLIEKTALLDEEKEGSDQ